MTDIPNYAADQAMAELDWLIADAAAEQKLHPEGDEWIPEWFMGKDKGYTDAIATVKEQAAKRIKQLEARRAGLWWKFGMRFQSQVDKDVRAQEGKQKSVHYLSGTAGFRTTGGKPKVIVLDKAKAGIALDKAYPEAVTYNINKPAVLKYYKETGEVVDGIEIETEEAHETFFPKRPEKLALEEEITDE